MPATSEIQAGIAKLTELGNKWNDILNGGPTETVETDNGDLPTLAKLIADLSTQIVEGFEAGYVVVAVNEAARLLATPAQAYQLLIQADTKALYYAPNTAPGSWVIHPVEAAKAAADTATAAVTALSASVAGKMSTGTYVGGAAAGVVRTAERISTLVDFAAANPNASLRIYGVQNGSLGLFVPTQTTKGAYLINGAKQVNTADNHSDIANTSRNCMGIGANFALINSPTRVLSWGKQDKAGILGTGLTATQSFLPRVGIATQQPDRNLPGFDPSSLATPAGQVVRVISLQVATMVLTADGLVLVAGATGTGARALMGSGVDKTQTVFMPIYFNQSGVNKEIRLMDAADATASLNCTAIFVDESEGVWLLTTNPASAGYGNALSGAQLTPVRLNPGFSSWEGKIVKKVRCDVAGGIYILFTNGELWAGGGSNATGMLGTGSTSNVLNPVQVQTGVDDFDVSGDTAGTALSLWILQGTTLKGAGYNANGQLGQTTGPTANKSSFVTIATDVELARLGGSDNVTLIYKKSNGDWYGLGRNTDGAFGQGASATNNNVPVLLSNLKTKVTDNGGCEAFVVAGYGGKHAACLVCTNGKAFTAGNNTDGCLANGNETNANTWQEVLWTRQDTGEKIIDVSPCVGPASSPAFTWLTNYGRILQAGAADFGFSSGVTPTAVHNVLTASPVQINGSV